MGHETKTILAVAFALSGAACGDAAETLESGSHTGSHTSGDVGFQRFETFGTGTTDVGTYYRVRSVGNNNCIDVSGVSQGNNAAVVNWACGAGENQQWYFRVVGNGSYQLSAKHSAKCLRVAGGSTGDGALLVQDPCARSGSGFLGSQFTATRVGTTTPARYQLVNQNGGKCLQVLSSGTQLAQNPCSTATSFLWTLDPVAPPAVNPAVTGQWSPVYGLQSVPVAAALLPSGKVLTWASWQRNSFTGTGALDRTYTVLFDPQAPTAPVEFLVTNTAHNMFCPGTAILADGRVFVNGGDDSHTVTTSIYSPTAGANGSWANARAMNQSRWYNTSVTLPDGRVFTLGGNRTSGQTGTGEIWNPATNTWTMVPNAVMGPLTAGAPADSRPEEHPRLFVAPDGRLFVPGPTPNMQYYNVSGSGTITAAGTRGTGANLDEFSQNDVTVPFDTGLFLKAGGNPNYDRSGAATTPSSQSSYVIDIRNVTPVVTKIASMKYPRAMANGVVLPNGEVFVVGGLDNGKAFSDDGGVLVPEMFNPANNSWRELAPMAIVRPYHALALLLLDGRVLVGGGGLCIGNDPCPVNHPNVEIYSPPYLAQGTRPSISSAPSNVTANGSTFNVSVGGTVTGFSLVRFSSVTHSTNTDQRFMRVSSTGTGTTRTLTAPANKNIAPPGYYMLFALNGNVPSVGRTVLIQ